MSVFCPTCNKQCASEGGLRNHVRLAHGSGLHVVKVGAPSAPTIREPSAIEPTPRVIGTPLQQAQTVPEADSELGRAVDHVTRTEPRPGDRIMAVIKGVPLSFWHCKKTQRPHRGTNRHHTARSAKLKHRRARKAG